MIQTQAEEFTAICRGWILAPQPSSCPIHPQDHSDPPLPLTHTLQLPRKRQGFQCFTNTCTSTGLGEWWRSITKSFQKRAPLILPELQIANTCRKTTTSWLPFLFQQQQRKVTALKVRVLWNADRPLCTSFTIWSWQGIWSRKLYAAQEKLLLFPISEQYELPAMGNQADTWLSLEAELQRQRFNSS